MSITVVIPAYKKPEQLEKCKAALAECRGAVNNIHVWDNNEENIGFTAGVNAVIRKYQMLKYVVVLNQDCYLRPDALEKIETFMDTHPKCAIAGIKQLSDQNEDVIIHGGCKEAYPAGVHIGGLVSKGDCAESKQMPWANGACLVVRTSALQDIGLMDENMFLIGSDSDWCFTARARGYEVWYIADAVCVHEQGVTAGSEDPFLRKAMFKDMLYWKSKWIDGRLFRELSMEIFPK